jgi:hypothetical protein
MKKRKPSRPRTKRIATTRIAQYLTRMPRQQWLDLQQRVELDRALLEVYAPAIKQQLENTSSFLRLFR